MKYWQHITLAYLTEESDDPDNPNGIIEHKIAWRFHGKYGKLTFSLKFNNNY